VEGWIPEDCEADVRKLLDESGTYYEIRAAKREDNAPIKLKNNAYTRMYEVLTKMYGMPEYAEFDPTPILAPFFSLFFAFCMMCRTLAPQTGFWRRADNPLAERLRNEFPIVQASAFLWFVAGSPWQRAIHGFKYYNRWRTARDLGAWYGGNLADSGLYGSVDCIVPVPLHTRRLLARGYNQAAYIAEGIASRMGVPVEDRVVRRLRNNPSQTTRSSAGRWENVRDLFAVARPGALAGRHVLLVDDVVTTGSTLLSCTEALLRAVPDCRVSIAALAVSRRHFGLDR
jgi:ComF family protein